MRKEIIQILKEKMPPGLWKTVWWIVPLSAIFLLPVGLLFTSVLGYLGFEAVARLTQMLMLFSVVFGFASGITILRLVKFTDFADSFASKVKWLARFAAVLPLLTLLILFLIFSR